jgi:hypothetical protein
VTGGTGLGGAARAALMTMRTPTCKIAVPVRLPSWLTGDLGKSIERTLRDPLRKLPSLRLTRLPRGFLIEAYEAPGPLLEAVYYAVVELEVRTKHAFPVLYHDLGPIWTGTLQAVFETPEPQNSPPVAGPVTDELATPAPEDAGAS